ncbi:hypothetical protein V1525DRAFT_410900 [Lipomyces kononenkoae]|uniref:Uncharacterized protein n=1 Tax=Lipomyces kononenkoae TaxID=34357 RepID=A0ACC3SUX6_LIPKO
MLVTLRTSQISTTRRMAQTAQYILVCRAEIPSRLSPQQLSTFAKENGITFQTIGQTCWAVLLSYYVGLSDVVFGTVLSGRTTAEEDEQVQFPSYPRMHQLDYVQVPNFCRARALVGSIYIVM